MATFSVLVLTACPAGQAGEGGGAFVKIDGREALLRSVELFLNRDNVKQIQLALLPDSFEESKRKFGPHLGFSGVKLINAGPRWMDQIAAAGATISTDATHVIVHDAARPAVPYSDIDALMSAVEKSDAAALVAPLRSTLVEVDDQGNGLAFRSPREFMQLQTPQVFSVEKFQEMVKTKAELHASQLALIKGSALNMRAGGAGEAGILRAMMTMLPKPKSKAPFSPFEEAQW